MPCSGKNQIYIVNIEGLNAEGHGIGSIDGFKMFIPGALPGETVRILTVKLKKTFGYGKLLEVIEPSDMRVEPLCEVFGKCGGCGLQHMSYAAQLEYKTKKVADALRKIGGADCAVLSTIGVKDPYRYRNKAQFPVRAACDGGVDIGFFAARSHRIVPINDCALQSPVNKRILSTIKNFMLKNKIKPFIEPFDQERHMGLIRHVITRVGYKTGEIMVCIVINGENLPHSAELVRELLQIKNMTSIVLNINMRRTNVIMGERVETLYGQGFITDNVGAVKLRISPKSFFQVNTPQTEVLYKTAAEFARLSLNDTVIDAYCGIGSISLFIADRVKKVWGIEITPEAIADARVNAELNGVENVEFLCGSTENELAGLAARVSPDVIFLDPPRKGCDRRVLSAAAQSGAERIIYISCDPATLARDVKIIAAMGYVAQKAQPVDMFAMTPHVETVVAMQRVGT